MSRGREKDRESGTGQPIKSIPPKGGSGKGNWGSDQQEIDAALQDQHNDQQNRVRKRGWKEPESFAANNQTTEPKAEQSWDEYMKSRSKAKAYKVATVKNEYYTKDPVSAEKHEQETDALFAGTSKKKKKSKKKAKKRVYLKTDVYFSDVKESRGRGRGRGRGYNNMRGGGYRGGYRGGYGQYGGYRGRGGGFGSRGRGTTYNNNNYDNNNQNNNYGNNNNQNYQNQNEYQGGGQQPQYQQNQPPQQQPPSNQELNIPESVQ